MLKTTTLWKITDSDGVYYVLANSLVQALEVAKKVKAKECGGAVSFHPIVAELLHGTVYADTTHDY